MAAATKDFCQNLPKLELHAHLNGSISDSTLDKLLQKKDGDGLEKSKLTIKDGQTHTLDEIFDKFKQIHQVADNEEAVYEITSDVIQEFAADNVKYLELRSTPREEPYTGLTKRLYIETILKAIQDQEKITPGIIVRFLLSIDRRHTKENIVDTILLAEEFMKSSNGRVVGVDLSGDPSVGSAAELSPLLHDARQRGLKLTVHLGEIQNKEDTLELLRLRPDRVGHGTYLHPEVGGTQEMVNLVLQNRLPLELCLSSNVKGKTVKGYSDHHFKYWFDQGHPCLLATDDKGVFSTSLSEEFHIAARTFNLTCEQLWDISYQSVEYIFADDSVKQTLRENWFTQKQKQALLGAQL